MPCCLAPSSVFPTTHSAPPTTEAQERFVDWKSYERDSVRPYRGMQPVEAQQVMAQPPTLLAQLGSLTARLQALRQPAAPQAAIDDIAARIAQLEGSMLSADAGQKPWEGSTYDTFAKYAGEASRVRSTGRLPFGSDNKKMAI